MHLIRVVVSLCQFLLLQLFLLQPTNCLIKYSRPVFQFDQDCGVPKFEGPFMTEKVPQSNLDDAIVAGTVTFRGSLPWIGAIGLKLDFGNVIWFCGSTLISRQWVVTSAHCLAKNWTKEAMDNRKLVVKLGGGPLDDNDDDDGLFIIEKIAIHPDYDHDYVNDVGNDVALAGISLPDGLDSINPEDVGPPACLTSDRIDTAGTEAMIAGYGRTRYRGSASKRLLEAKVEIRPRDVCATSYPTVFVDGETKVFCANGAFPEDGRRSEAVHSVAELKNPVADACQGDSGGPLMMKTKAKIHGISSMTDTDDTRFFVAGIIAGGRGCGDPHSPGIYVDVRSHISWIAKVLA